MVLFQSITNSNCVFIFNFFALVYFFLEEKKMTFSISFLVYFCLFCLFISTFANKLAQKISRNASL